MPSTALTSAEISLPSTADAVRVRERIATLADTVDLIGLTDNHPDSRGCRRWLR